jgi:hypothetical protein
MLPNLLGTKGYVVVVVVTMLLYMYCIKRQAFSMML